MLIGREPERTRLAELLDRARGGSAEVVVVRGEPGIGKTALVSDLISAAGDAQVLHCQGVEAEAPLAFAALHRLLRPLTRLRNQLTAPQARVLRNVFGEEVGPAVEPFMVGVATLSILTTAAEDGLVLCVIDDAHWLDSASMAALTFCARRVDADRVLMVFAARDGSGRELGLDGLPELVVTGLDRDSSLALLESRLGSASPGLVDRLAAETSGNPLALLELPTALTADQLHGSAPLPDHLLLTTKVERAFLDRSRALPESTQRVLLVAAMAETGDVGVVTSASSRLGVDEGALEMALGSGLLVGDAQQVHVQHPLVRSAVLQGASAAARRLVHRALADALHEYGDAERATWHRAAATNGPDPVIADEVGRLGEAAERRGGFATASAAFERAAALTTDRSRRAELTFAAARAAWAGGRAEQSVELLASAGRITTDRLLLADVARLRGRIEVNIGSATDAHRIFVEAAAAVSDLDPGRALEMAVAAGLLRSYGADSGARPAAGDDFDLVASAAEDSPRTACLRQLHRALTRMAESDWSGAAEAFAVAARIGDSVVDLDVLGNLGNTALQLGDDDAQRRFYAMELSRGREAGAVMAVIYALHRLCFGHLVAGDWVAVRTCAEEALAIAESIGARALTAPPLAWLTLLAALQGRDEYDDKLRVADQMTSAHPLGILTDPVHDLLRWAKAARAAGVNDSVDALHHLSRIRVPAIARMAATEALDVAVRAGEPETANGWTDAIAGFAVGTRRPWALATVSFGRAVTAAPTEAEAWYLDALRQHAEASRPVDRARIQLVYGEWLRRAQRRVDARQHLRAALAVFQDVRAEPLADRATQELRASGETARKRDPSTLVALTPMERHVAQLVASGLSNKDVAAHCWISPRTVAFHLRNVFAKAGITSRGELAGLDLA